ncbi:MAG: hypothetical protein JWP26_3865 [Devosia sp.]|uniref:glycoside hydrolase family 2 protein n=1 Tax=Devosia sp. TaxID=1871048 RepID=UPI002614031A|nr:glycoside hydrolase family 2 TIM barrel-domain containing protein [Devosia sp.]MDB5588895.1 hypothetical protein [Devosia sp.]
MQQTKELALPIYAPLPLDPTGSMSLDLCGAWNYLQPIADPFARQPLPSDVTLQVPGEVIMQGLPFDPAAAFALERTFAVPAAWAGRVVRLRFEAVYSQCTVWIDGRPAGHHLGGFTPFDLDLTDQVKAGEQARVTLHITNNSIADTLAQQTNYAFHPLAGISRKVTLFALPSDHFEVFDVATIFAAGDLSRATLQLDLQVSRPGPVDVELVTPAGDVRPLGTRHIDGTARLAFAVEAPELWHTEHPALHTVRLSYAGSTYSRRIGFRDVRVDGGKILLNGRSIYLRGVCHHETHPLTGRADTARWAQTDVSLFRAANVNFIRTSHYPPTKELVEACDEAGMLLEVEAPFCWSFGRFEKMSTWEELSAAEQAAASDYVSAVSLEMVSYYRSNPSVIIWSVANESNWAPPFERSAAAILRADPTRPTTFNWDKLGPECTGHVDIANHHYPEAGETARFAVEPRPVMFDEFAHLYCYNSREMVTDPGLRQHWGKFLGQQWDEIRALPNGIGGSIWAAIDDHFYIPQRDGSRKWVGYGEWGPLDGWRRPKPEYEQMKRVYDPIQVHRDGALITVENRFDFTDLSAVDCTWQAGEQAGRATLSALPGQVATIQLPAGLADRSFELHFRVPSLGYDRRISLAAAAGATAPVASRPALQPVRRNGEDMRIGSWQFLGGDNGPVVVTPGGERLPLALAIVPSFPSWDANKRPPGKVMPLENLMTGWQLADIHSSADSVNFVGSYGAAKGKLSLSVDEDDGLVVGYEFEALEPLAPLQIGLALDLPPSWDNLRWQLAGPANDLPDDHLSRSRGEARARALGPDEQMPAAAPSWPWKDDVSNLGSNDFRATKLGIERAGLFAQTDIGLCVQSDGTQHVRAQAGPDGMRFYALDWTGEGSERFLATFAQPLNLETGHVLSGEVRFAYGPWG